MQLLGWRHLVNWGRTLSVGGLLLGIPCLCWAVSNGNSIMTGAAEPDVWNISSTAAPATMAVFGFITSLVSSWMATGRISPTDAAVQMAFKNLAVLALNSPTAAHLLQQLKEQIDPATDPTSQRTPLPIDSLLTPAEYLTLLEKSIRLEISKSCIK